MAGVPIVHYLAPPLISIFIFSLGTRMIVFFSGGSGHYLQRPGNGVYYRLGVRTYVELPELLKTFDVDTPQVCRFCSLGGQLAGNMRCFIQGSRYVMSWQKGCVCTLMRLLLVHTRCVLRYC